jgi:acyl-CoA synthetase (AMP-forming)/AMP-acid ligase II
LEAIFGIVAAGGVVVPANYRLKEDEIAYIFGHAEVDCVIVDREFENLLDEFRKKHGKMHLIVDWVSSLHKSSNSFRCQIISQRPTVLLRMCLHPKGLHVVRSTRP